MRAGGAAIPPPDRFGAAARGLPKTAISAALPSNSRPGPTPKSHDGFGSAKLLQLSRDERANIACSAIVLAPMTGLNRYEKLWRTALHATLSAFVVAILGLGIAPTANAAAATATLSVQHSWQTGFIANFTVTNASIVPLPDWRLEFDLPVGEGLSHTWNSSFVQSGTHFVITPANWNRTIAPGGSATGGMRGVLTGSFSPPVNCRINGQACT
jgi:cellulase/cellobiase CelA1